MTDKNEAEREKFEAALPLRADRGMRNGEYWNTVVQARWQGCQDRAATDNTATELSLAVSQFPALAGMTPAGAIGWLTVELAARTDMTENKDALRSAVKALQIALPYMQTDEGGHCPDCTPILQAMMDCNAALSHPAGEAQPDAVRDTSQDWAKLAGADAYLLIGRHGEDWADIGRKMDAWGAARFAAPPSSCAQPVAPEGLIERLKGHSEDKRNTAFARSSMREAIEYLAAPPSSDIGAQPMTRETLYAAIHDALMNHSLMHTADADGGELPLIDGLTPPGSGSIKSGREEIARLADAIIDVLPDFGAAPPEQAQPDCWQISDGDGVWINMSKDRIAEFSERGWQVRSLYATPPTEPLQGTQEPAMTDERKADLYDEIESDLNYLFGRASKEGHEAGQKLAEQVREKMQRARAAIAAPAPIASPATLTGDDHE